MIYYNTGEGIGLKETAVALGKFDGLHRGHQLLFSELRRYKEEGLTTVVFTFDFHPMSLLSGKKQQLIYTRGERRKILEDLGIDVMIEFPFTIETSKTEAEDFIRDTLVHELGVKAVVVGDDFRFGHNRGGDVALLKKLGQVYGYTVDNCRKLRYGDREISSSYVRDLIKEGQLETVTMLLGRPYSISGEIIHGKGNGGNKLSMPTANIAPEADKLLPPDGVYVSSVVINDKVYRAVTNIGHNPTIGENNALRAETYILDFSGDLYGEKLNVELHRRLRGEIKFDGFESLKAQMMKDVEQARDYFEAACQ